MVLVEPEILETAVVFVLIVELVTGDTFEEEGVGGIILLKSVVPKVHSSVLVRVLSNEVETVEVGPLKNGNLRENMEFGPNVTPAFNELSVVVVPLVGLLLTAAGEEVTAEVLLGEGVLVTANVALAATVTFISVELVPSTVASRLEVLVLVGKLRTADVEVMPVKLLGMDVSGDADEELSPVQLGAIVPSVLDTSLGLVERRLLSIVAMLTSEDEEGTVDVQVALSPAGFVGPNGSEVTGRLVLVEELVSMGPNVLLTLKELVELVIPSIVEEIVLSKELSTIDAEVELTST